MAPIGPLKPLIRLGAGLLGLAVLAGVWELLARQSPGTPLYLGMLPGPIAALRELATTLGLTLLITSLLMGWKGQAPSRALLWVFCAGTLTSVAAQLYGALHGMPGVQIVDFRPGVRPLFVTKHVGLALVVGALIQVARQVLGEPHTRKIRLGRDGGSAAVQLDSEERRH